MIHARKSTRGAKWYLMPPADISAFIAFISRAQTQAGVFENVTVKPYKGKKVQSRFSMGCCWLINRGFENVACDLDYFPVYVVG